MKLFVVLAVLCVSALADDRDTIRADLEGSIQSISTALNTANNMVSRTVKMKLNLKRTCWTAITNNVTANSQEIKNMNALSNHLKSLNSKLSVASDISSYQKEILTGNNTPITQIVNAGAELANTLNNVISKLDINSNC